MPTFRPVANILCFASLLGLGAVTTYGDEPFTYRFKPGRELVYEISGESVRISNYRSLSQSVSLTDGEIRVFPIRENIDGSYRLVIYGYFYRQHGSREIESTRDVESVAEWSGPLKVSLDHAYLGYCDLMPDGTYKQNDTIDRGSWYYGLYPSLIFKQLPAEGTGDKKHELVDRGTGVPYSYVTQKDDQRLLILKGAHRKTESDYDDLLDIRASFRHVHDRDIRVSCDSKLGHPVEIKNYDEYQSENSEGVGFVSYRLTDKIEHPRNWMARLESQTDRYFQVHREWENQVRLSSESRTEDACQNLLNSARNSLVAERERETIAYAKSAYAGLVSIHDRDSPNRLRNARDREKSYGAEPVDWVSKSLTGATRRASDYRGKILVLCFFSTGVRSSIKTIPTLKSLHEEYQGKDIVVLGVGCDNDFEDTRRLCNRYNIPYDVVSVFQDYENRLSFPYLSKLYNVSGSQNCVILDRNGKVSTILEDTTFDLAERLRASIDSLLVSGDADNLEK